MIYIRIFLLFYTLNRNLFLSKKAYISQWINRQYLSQYIYNQYTKLKTTSLFMGRPMLDESIF